MNRKGLVNIVDAVAIFSVGVLIITFIFFATENMRKNVADTTAKEKFENIANYVSSSITKAYIAGINAKEEGSSGIVKAEISIEIPSSISGYTYVVIIEGTMVTVQSVNLASTSENVKIEVSVPIVGVPPNYIVPTKIFSSQKKFRIIYIQVEDNPPSISIVG